MSPPMSDASVSGLLLVAPAAFGFNAETAATNRFQTQIALPDAATAAQQEFAAFAATLRQAEVDICIAPDTPEPAKPDAVFPNNWVSFHEDGTVVTYPMHSPLRRAERREAVINCMKHTLGFTESRRIDLSTEELNGRFLEGTGSLVLDRVARIAYACRSSRTEESLVHEWSRLMGYEPFLFDAATPDGTPVYHTNVVLWIGADIAGVGLEWVAAAQRTALLDRLQTSGKSVLPLSNAQLRAFAGNMLEVHTRRNTRQLVMSASAAASLDDSQRTLLRHVQCQPLVAAIPTIERLGGGSVRCMLAEVPLQAKASN
jgi:hypothetical protein